VDRHFLRLLEYDRVTATIAARAECAAARMRLEAWAPLPAGPVRAQEHARLSEALRRQREPGTWCFVGPDPLGPLIDANRREPLDGAGLLAVRAWLDAAHEVAAAWQGDEMAARFAALVALVGGLPDLSALRSRLAKCLDPDGRIADAASPALARARRELESGERAIEQRLERWARTFGAESYITRHGERFVALVPAAGFPRRRALVHDVSGSGQSLFVEPLEFTEANNHLIELRGAVADEERRILRELNAAVADAAPALAVLEDVLVALDTLRARARWAGETNGSALLPGGGRLALTGARHPLLALSARRDTVVPLDLTLEPPGRLLLVSGPNMGGKTVLLKTVGLAVALAHAALPVPAAEGSAVPEVDAIVVDLGDEQSVDQGLSTFAAHLRALATMADAAGPRTLLLCDELGAGTDPEEGAALGRALLEHFAARGAWGVVSTHLGSLKRVAGEVAGIVNGSLEFDVATLTPRFRFLPGIPGASHALDVAGRLGLPAPLLERARALAPAEAVALERLLAELQQIQARLDDERAACARAREQADTAAERLRATEADARRTLEDTRRRLTRESEAVLANARELWQTMQREARRADRRREHAEHARAALSGVEAQLEHLVEEADHAVRAAGGAPAASPAPVVEAGRRVHVRDLGVDAEVVSGPDAEGRVLLRRGNWSIHSHLDRLEAAGETAGGAERAAPGAWQVPEEAPAFEVDLRGMEVDEAIRALDQALDRAVVSGFTELRIVHGIGRGVLRAAVERHLRGHPQVTRARIGLGHEGGRGATVAALR
jgi:DNA mismatch repair protein MutS2